MTAGAVLLAFGFFGLGGSALIAFFWAVRTGQLRNLDKAPAIIFDGAEPVGLVSDCFPDQKSRSAVQRRSKNL